MRNTAHCIGKVLLQNMMILLLIHCILWLCHILCKISCACLRHSFNAPITKNTGITVTLVAMSPCSLSLRLVLLVQYSQFYHQHISSYYFKFYYLKCKVDYVVQIKWQYISFTDRCNNFCKDYIPPLGYPERSKMTKLSTVSTCRVKALKIFVVEMGMFLHVPLPFPPNYY